MPTAAGDAVAQGRPSRPGIPAGPAASGPGPVKTWVPPQPPAIAVRGLGGNVSTEAVGLERIGTADAVGTTLGAQPATTAATRIAGTTHVGRCRPDHRRSHPL